jgi:Outer membrane protein beta-barrel domain
VTIRHNLLLFNALARTLLYLAAQTGRRWAARINLEEEIMKKTGFASVAAVALALVAVDANAQLPIPLSIEGRADYAMPMGDFDDVVDPGVSFSGGASIGLAPGVGLYGTYSHTEFKVQDSDDIEVNDKGFSVGLTTALPTMSGISPWIGIGAVFHTLNVDDADDDDAIDEDVGFEVGGGLAIPVTRNIRLTPGVGYRQYGIDSTLGGSELDVQYFTAGLGLNISF